MSWDDLVQSVESHDFAVELNLANDWRTFQRFLGVHPVIRELIQSARDPDDASRMLARIHDLSRREPDPRYENVWDVALSVYIWALSHTNPQYGAIALRMADRAKHCWWTPLMVERLTAHLAPYQQAGVSTRIQSSPQFQVAVEAFAGRTAFDRVLCPDALRQTSMSSVVPVYRGLAVSGVANVRRSLTDLLRGLSTSATGAGDSEALAA